MSTGTALGIIGAAVLGGLVVLMVGVLSVMRRKGRAPSATELLIIMIAVAVAVLLVACLLAPDAPAAPMLVEPSTYDPPRDLLSGEPL